MSTELALYEHAREALAEAVSFDEVTRIKTKAEQAKAYARIAKDRKLMADAQELVARAERKLGIMLRAAKDDGLLSQGGRPAAERSNVAEPETGADAEPVFDSTPFTLADLGISKKLSSRAQQLAELDEETFEESVTATRDKILSDSAVVTGPKTVRAAPEPKPEPIKPLAEEQWHRFVFAVLAVTMASDRVSSRAIHLLAENRGIVVLDGDTVDFTPEAMKAMGPLADVALRALDGEQNTEAKASTDGDAPEQDIEPPADSVTGDASRLAAGRTADASGGDSPASNAGQQGGEQPESVTAGETAINPLLAEYRRQLALIWLELGHLTMAQAEPAMRAGYAADVPVKRLAEDLGHPLGTVKTWANRLELTSIDRMHARQQRFGAAT